MIDKENEMLTTAADYKFVKTNDISQFINGDIMPIVFPNKNTKAFTRFEDYLFLLEGYYERMNPELEGNNSIIPPTRTIYASKMLGTGLTQDGDYVKCVKMGYNNRQSMYINPNSTIPQQTINKKIVGGENIDVLSEYMTNTKLELAAYKQYSIRPQNKSALKSEYIRGRYYDLRNCKRLIIPLSLGDFMSQCIVNRYDADGDIVLTSEEDLYARNSGYLFSTVSLRKSIDSDITFKQNFFVLPYSKSAKFIYVTRISSSWYGRNYIICSSIDLQSVNGAIACPNNLLDTMMVTSQNASGENFYTQDIDVYFNIEYSYLLVDFDFPADLDGIQWSWTP